MYGMPEFNVWYIYLHLPKKITKCRQIYHSQSIWISERSRFHIYIYIDLLVTNMILVAGRIQKPLSPGKAKNTNFQACWPCFIQHSEGKSNTWICWSSCGGSTPLKNILNIKMDHFHKCFRVNIQTKTPQKKTHHLVMMLFSNKLNVWCTMF